MALIDLDSAEAMLSQFAASTYPIVIPAAIAATNSPMGSNKPPKLIPKNAKPPLMAGKNPTIIRKAPPNKLATPTRPAITAINVCVAGERLLNQTSSDVMPSRTAAITGKKVLPIISEVSPNSALSIFILPCTVSAIVTAEPDTCSCIAARAAALPAPSLSDIPYRLSIPTLP